MKLGIGLLVFVVFIYTVGFAITLWKDKNKMGTFAILILAISIVIVPFFSDIR